MSTVIILDTRVPADAAALDTLRRDPNVEFIDRYAEQHAALLALRPTPGPDLVDEPARWVYYPWRRAVLRVLGPNAFRAVRLDRNRNLITDAEQDTLTGLRIGIVGLSVGHVIAHTLATEGLCGELRLADFDELELSNLNRVPATLFDLGMNKATVAARRVLELDPYIEVDAHTDGLTPENIDRFIDGLDILVEECDSLDMKVMVRAAARRRGIPVLMATSDRGLMDIERFDLEPQRPVLHGLLGDIDPAELRGLAPAAKVSHVLKLVDAKTLSARGAASLVELGSTLSTWPQLAGDVVLGATACAEAVRRIGLGEELGSGRVRIDIAKALDELTDPADTVDVADARHPALVGGTEHRTPTVADLVVEAAIRAPSGGNTQPWQVEKRPSAVALSIATEHTSMMDVEFRGSAVALGAAVFNARVAAAAHGVLGAVEVGEPTEASPLSTTLRLDGGRTDSGDPALAGLYDAVLRRETNRHQGDTRPLDACVADTLQAAAVRHGARLALLGERTEIDSAAKILAESDRIRYLTPRLHAEMVSELRWPGDASPDSGLDIRTLELDPGMYASLDIMRRPDVMSHLAEWDAGAALGAGTQAKVRACSALAVLNVDGGTLADYARGGSALEAVWIAAQQSGLAVHPVSPVFLYARDDLDLRKLSPAFADRLGRLQRGFADLAGTQEHESQVLILRLFRAPAAPTMRSRRDTDRVRLPLR